MKIFFIQLDYEVNITFLNLTNKRKYDFLILDFLKRLRKKSFLVLLHLDYL